MKKLIGKYRSVIALLLLGWLLLCGAMPLLAGNMLLMEANDGESSVSHSHHHLSVLGGALDKPQPEMSDQHCCDAMADGMFAMQPQFIDLLLAISLVFMACCFIVFWIVPRKCHAYCNLFALLSGPPLHQRLCVWLD